MPQHNCHKNTVRRKILNGKSGKFGYEPFVNFYSLIISVLQIHVR